ncbi:hypothetical protein CASFOL_031709 [Castilleja foliolosa]|uniref:Uncharacterized protein n=1 Tax=Castilleja foliolosa TaxID=1961234 RepID=A0ABD3C5H4_9LAMI
MSTKITTITTRTSRTLNQYYHRDTAISPFVLEWMLGDGYYVREWTRGAEDQWDKACLDKLDKYVTAFRFHVQERSGTGYFLRKHNKVKRSNGQILAIDEDNVCIETKEGLQNCKLIAVHAGMEKGKGVEEQICWKLCNASIAKTFKRRNKQVKRVPNRASKQMKKEYSLASQGRIKLNEPRNIGAISFTNDRFVDSFRQQAPINYIPPPHNIGPAIPDHRYPLLGTKRPFSHLVCLLKLLAKDTSIPKVEPLSGRKKRLEYTGEELTKTMTIVISGHHGKVHIEEYRLI